MKTNGQDTTPATETPTEQGKGTESGEVQGQEQKTEPKPDANLISLSQSDLDKKIGEAVFKAVSKVKSEQEESRLKEKGEFETLANTYKAELESIKAEKEKSEFRASALDYITKNNLGSFQEVLLSLPSLEAIEKAGLVLGTKLQEEAERRVKERLTNTSPASTAPVTTNPFASDEAWKAHKAAMQTDTYF